MKMSFPPPLSRVNSVSVETGSSMLAQMCPYDPNNREKVHAIRVTTAEPQNGMSLAAKNSTKFCSWAIFIM